MYPEPGEVSPVGGAVDRLLTHRCHHRTRWNLLISPNVAKYGKKTEVSWVQTLCSHFTSLSWVSSGSVPHRWHENPSGCRRYLLYILAARNKKKQNSDRKRARERENTTARRHSSFILINRSSAKRSHAYRRLTI